MGKLGLALGGGASKGLSTFAIIEEMQKLNINVDYISGSSVGAIVGAYYALYGEVDSLREELLEFSSRKWKKFMDFKRLPKESLIKAKRYKEFLFEKFGAKRFSDTKIPLVISVTNLVTKKTEYITKGSIFEAVVASSAYPGIFPPFRKGKAVYVDGGVLDNLPYEILLKKGMDKVVVINLCDQYNNQKVENIFDIVRASIDLMIENAFKGVEKQNKKIFVFRPKFKYSISSSWNVKDLNEKYERGKKEFDSKKQDFLRWIKC